MDLKSQKQINVSPKLKMVHRRQWLVEWWDSLTCWKEPNNGLVPYPPVMPKKDLLHQDELGAFLSSIFLNE